MIGKHKINKKIYSELEAEKGFTYYLSIDGRLKKLLDLPGEEIIEMDENETAKVMYYSVVGNKNTLFAFGESEKEFFERLFEFDEAKEFNNMGLNSIKNAKLVHEVEFPKEFIKIEILIT